MGWTALASSLSTLPDLYWQGATLRGLHFYGNGADELRMYDGVRSTDFVACPYKPAAAPTVADSGVTGVLDGTYHYKFSYYDSHYDFEAAGQHGITIRSSREGPLSDASSALTVSLKKASITIPTDPDVAKTGTDKAVVYRTAYNSGTATESTDYYFVAIVAQNAVYTDNTDDDDLVQVAPATNVRPPLCTSMMEFNDHLWLCGSLPYETGTIAVTNGEDTVTGTSTVWNRGMIGANFMVMSDGGLYRIYDVNESTQVLTLMDAVDGTAVTYRGTTIASGGLYRIWTDTRRIWSSKRSGGIPYPWHYAGTDDEDEARIFDMNNLNDKAVALYTCMDRAYVFGYNCIEEINPLGSDEFDIEPRVTGVGIAGPRAASQLTNGSLIFLGSDRQIHRYEGGSEAPVISTAIAPTLEGINGSMLRYSHACTFAARNLWFLFTSLSSASDFDTCIVYDPAIQGWWIFRMNFSASCSVRGTVYAGDAKGMAYRWPYGTADGVPSGTVTGTATAGGATSLTDSTATFYTQGSGLAGRWVEILSGTGAGDRQQIVSNTATALTVTSWGVATPDTTTVYTVGGIGAYWKSKWFTQQGVQRIMKIVEARCRDETTGSLTVDVYREYDTTAYESFTLDVTDSWMPRLVCNVRARFHSVAFTNKYPSQPFKIFDVLLEMHEAE